MVPHVLRHTCATWLAQRRTPISEICALLGMTEEMFERVYGHHHPDYQASAVNALTSSGGQFAGGLAATKREPGARNVSNLREKRK